LPSIRMKILRFLLPLFLALWLQGTGETAQEDIRVVVFPFEVHSLEDLTSLEQQLRFLIEKGLRDEGATVLEPGQAPEGASMGEGGVERMRTAGMTAGADFVVWGSFTKIGNRFSLDVKVLESYGDAPPEPVYSEGEEIETLLTSVQVLAKEVGLKIFKREIVDEVLVKGNQRIESEAIKKVIKTQPGDVYVDKNLQQDVKSVYRMGYFSDVRVETSDTPKGKEVIFNVVENETVRDVNIEGNEEFDDEKIREFITVRSSSIVNVNRLQGDLQQIEKMYKEKGYYHAAVSYEIQPVEGNRADIVFNIEEGEKVLIKDVVFEGNKAYDSDKLEGLMKTREKGLLSWFTTEGDLDPEILDQDVSRIAAYYNNHGYIHAKVADPELTYEGNWIFIKIKIEEGPQFKVGKVDIEGDLVLPKEELLARLKLTQEEVYNRETIREDILNLQDIYSDLGYAHADVSPRIDQDAEKLEANITYLINKGPIVYFEKILISGNTKTRDKVIRRVLRVYEQEPFNGKALKVSQKNINRLDYFEDVKVNTTQGSAEDKMVVRINVTEKATGAFSFGAGYSSAESLFGMVSVSQKNLFGRGQILNVRAQLGGTSTNYTLGFTEPWLFDTPISAGFDIYDTHRDWDSYDKDSIGGTLQLGYSLFDFTRINLSYNYDKSTIKNLDDDASHEIREFEGTNKAHTVTGVLRRDSRDQAFSPTEGSDNSIMIRHAGTPFGGDIGFTKYVVDTGWFIPVFWKLVASLHGRAGYITGDKIGKVPTWERFYLGGIDSVRGYNWRDISPRDPETWDEIGGDKMLQFNAELLFPIMQDAGLMGVVFYDTGNAWDNGEDIKFSDLRKSTGGGFRWYSPMGPMRLEYGYILETDSRGDGEKGDGKWEFAMGMAF
jgi:outer membrane protein insertion porin family